MLVFSPLASSVIAPRELQPGESPPPMFREPENEAYFTYPLVLHTIGQPPRDLPLPLLDLKHVLGGPIRPPRPFFFDYSRIGFIDETALVYAGTDYRLWRFDLNKWESELLWKPASGEPPGVRDEP
jgi:hypothetical protein